MVNIIESNLTFKGGLARRKVTNSIVLHHAAAKSCTVHDVHRWHLGNGWSGIGYQFFVRKDGSIHRGRPLDTVGAHVANHNSNTIGICAEGDYRYDTMPDAQKWAIVNLVRYIQTKYPNTKINGHRDYGGSICPGPKFPFDEIKRLVITNEGSDDMFRDIAGHWANADINAMARLGLVAVPDNKTFRPNDNITRAETVALILRAVKYVLGRVGQKVEG